MEDLKNILNKINNILKKYDNISKYDESEEAIAFYSLYSDIEELKNNYLILEEKENKNDLQKKW